MGNLSGSPASQEPRRGKVRAPGAVHVPDARSFSDSNPSRRIDHPGHVRMPPVGASQPTAGYHVCSPACASTAHPWLPGFPPSRTRRRTPSRDYHRSRRNHGGDKRPRCQTHCTSCAMIDPSTSAWWRSRESSTQSRRLSDQGRAVRRGLPTRVPGGTCHGNARAMPGAEIGIQGEEGGAGHREPHTMPIPPVAESTSGRIFWTGSRTAHVTAWRISQPLKSYRTCASSTTVA